MVYPSLNATNYINLLQPHRPDAYKIAKGNDSKNRQALSKHKTM